MEGEERKGEGEKRRGDGGRGVDRGDGGRGGRIKEIKLISDLHSAAVDGSAS